MSSITSKTCPNAIVDIKIDTSTYFFGVVGGIPAGGCGVDPSCESHLSAIQNKQCIYANEIHQCHDRFPLTSAIRAFSHGVAGSSLTWSFQNKYKYDQITCDCKREKIDAYLGPLCSRPMPTETGPIVRASHYGRAGRYRKTLISSQFRYEH